jgi:hypothetical protein
LEVALGLTGAARALLTLFAGGSALAALMSMVAAVSALIFGLIYKRYVGILGANRRRPAERHAYDAVRNSLTGGNPAARLYALWLTIFLDQVDRFFGDAGLADRTLFPRAFWAGDPSPAVDGSRFRTLPSARLNLPQQRSSSSGPFPVTSGPPNSLCIWTPVLRCGKGGSAPRRSCFRFMHYGLPLEWEDGSG